MSRHRLIVAGGGTGGHVLAGIAIAEAWKERFGGDARVLFVGARGGLEEKLVPRSGHPLLLLTLGSLKGVSWAKRARTLLLLPWAFVRSAFLLVSFRPSAVIGVGGYASGPPVLMARLLGWGWGMRVAILEQNAVPGFTNRLLSRLAHRVFTALPGIEGRFPRGKVIVTGNPIRSEFKPLEPASRDPFTIFVFGGSQGAMGINTLVLDALAELKDLIGPQGRLKILHQTGERDYDRVFQGHAQAGSGARVERFVYDMGTAYREASLLICRAGASTLSEIAAVGRASILVPFPFASDDHQAVNARILVDAGAALMLDQRSSRGADLARIVRELVAAPERIESIEGRVRSFYRPEAARDIVKNLC